MAALAEEYAVISTKLLAGRTVVRIYSAATPGPGFEPAEPDLADVYFSTMAGHVGSAARVTKRALRADQHCAQPEPGVTP